MSAPDRLGDFRVEEEIGRGGFGVVYKAHQVSLKRPVALKVLYEHKVHTTEAIARFEREAQAAARLDHRSIVSVYAWGKEGERFFIAQRLIGSGLTLADRVEQMKKDGEQPKGYFREIAEGLADIADALQHAHERGIIHRDVKPGNILLNDDGRPCLGDFGLAKIEDGLALSQTGDIAGSPYYMSPEQADSKRGPVDLRADIYSLGATLYELLALQPPFEAESAHEIVRKILNDEPKPPTSIIDRVPRDLDTICMKALEKGRSRRYQTAKEFGDDLRAFLDGEPISAVPASTVSRLWRRTRRHRSLMTTVVVAAVVITTVTFFLQKDAANEAAGRKQAENQAKVADNANSDIRQLDERVDDEITQRISEGRTDESLELIEQRRQLMSLLGQGQDLLVGALATGDRKLNEVLSEDGGQEEAGLSILAGLETLTDFYADSQQPAAGTAPDPAVEQAADLVEQVRDNPLFKSLFGGDGKATPGFDVDQLPVRTQGVDAGRIRPRRLSAETDAASGDAAPSEAASGEAASGEAEAGEATSGSEAEAAVELEGAVSGEAPEPGEGEGGEVGEPAEVESPSTPEEGEESGEGEDPEPDGETTAGDPGES